MEFSPRQTNTRDEIIDPWGTPVRFHFPSDGSRPEITSAGKDRQWDTKDDLSSLK